MPKGKMFNEFIEDEKQMTDDLKIILKTCLEFIQEFFLKKIFMNLGAIR